MNGHLNMYDPALHHNPIFGNIDNIEAFGFLVTRKNEKKPYFISAKLMNDSILSKIKKCRMKLEFVFLSGKSSPGNLKKKKFKTESRWLVHEMLTYRSKVWEVLMSLEDTEFTLTIEHSYLLCDDLRSKLKKELNEPHSSLSVFGHNMCEYVLNHGVKWYFF